MSFSKRSRAIGLGILLRRFASQAADPKSSFPLKPCTDCGKDVFQFPLREKWATSPDSYVLRFDFPAQLAGQTLGVPAPSGVKLHLRYADGAAEEKSYSPVSLEGSEGFVDLLVKSYPPVPSGGFGHFLCSLQPGQMAAMKIKKPREIHGSPEVHGRWSHLGLVAAGTGVAPFVQIARSLLANSEDRTQISLLSINRFESDILMRGELDELAARHPDRFRVSYSLTQPTEAWGGFRGRGSADTARSALPSPSLSGCSADGADSEPGTCKSGGPGTPGAGVMIMVCGTDGFRESWAGPVVKIKADPAKGIKKQKVQGPLLGWLKEAGFREDQVYKF